MTVKTMEGNSLFSSQSKWRFDDDVLTMNAGRLLIVLNMFPLSMCPLGAIVRGFVAEKVRVEQKLLYIIKVRFDDTKREIERELESYRGQ